MSKPEVVYTQNGVQKRISQEQANHMLEQIAATDMQRALVHSLNLTQANPDATELLWSFYERLLTMYMFEELLDLTNKRLASKPDCGVAFSWKLDALRHMFRSSEAIEMLRAAYIKDPRDHNAVTMLGTFYKDEGDFSKALSCFDQSIAVNPSYAPPYWHRAEIVSDHAASLAAVTQQISNSLVHETRAHYLQFAAYKHAEKLGDYQTAYEHLSFGNGLKRNNLKYNLSAELKIDNKAKEVFAPARLESLQNEVFSELRPIFILGMPRSGTTLVEQIIASHSDVAGGDEYTALANAVMRVQRSSPQEGGIDDWLLSRSAQDWIKVGKAYEHNMRFIRGDKTVFTDKNQFNHRSVGVIKAALPNAKIIVVDRNPMDVLFGCYRQLFGGDGAPFSYDYDELIALYNSYNHLIDYWDQNTDNLILRVSYEDLVTHPQRTTDDILEFCGLDLQQSCYDFHQTQRSVKTLSSSQVRQPIFTHGIKRWRTYQTQLGSLVQKAEKAGINVD